MRDLFDSLIASGAEAIRALVAERRQEDVQLDFKLKRDGTNGNFEQSDRVNLGKALSGFANSQGGLLIFGVDARKVGGIDAAFDCQPIADIAAFEAQAKSLAGHLIIPKHDGIHIASIREVDGSGYLLVLVERSERRPHRSEAKDEKYYYKRAGDSFFQMEHYDIEDAFRRTVVPVISLKWGVGLLRKSGNKRILRIGMIMENISKITAKNPMFAYRDNPHLKVLRNASNDGRKIHRIANIVYVTDINISFVHPGQSAVLETFEVEANFNGATIKFEDLPKGSSDWEIECYAACENMVMFKKEISINADSVVRSIGASAFI